MKTDSIVKLFLIPIVILTTSFIGGCVKVASQIPKSKQASKVKNVDEFLPFADDLYQQPNKNLDITLGVDAVQYGNNLLNAIDYSSDTPTEEVYEERALQGSRTAVNAVNKADIYVTIYNQEKQTVANYLAGKKLAEKETHYIKKLIEQDFISYLMRLELEVTRENVRQYFKDYLKQMLAAQEEKNNIRKKILIQRFKQSMVNHIDRVLGEINNYRYTNEKQLMRMVEDFDYDGYFNDKTGRFTHDASYTGIDFRADVDFHKVITDTFVIGWFGVYVDNKKLIKI